MSDIGNAKIMYLRVGGPQPRVVTLVYTLGKTETGNFYARVGYAICNREVDHFNKKIGRKIATGRLENVRTSLMLTYPEDAVTWPKRMIHLLDSLSSDKQAPRRLSSAVKKYILRQAALNEGAFL